MPCIAVTDRVLFPDAATRTNAEQQLLHAAEVDFVGALSFLNDTKWIQEHEF